MMYRSIQDAQAMPFSASIMLNMLKSDSHTLTFNRVECIYVRMFMAALEALYAINRFPIGFFSGSVMASLLLEVDPRPLEI